jgi:hypothetical protein
LQLYKSALGTFIGSLLLLLAACFVSAMRLMGPLRYGVAISSYLHLSVAACTCIVTSYWRFKCLVGRP